MAKREGFGAEAERLFVTENCTVAEIASRLRLGEKTVRNWKADGHWDDKRAQYIASRKSFHEELYEFCRTLMESIRKDMEAGKEPSAQRMNMARGLIGDLTKVKDYEDAARAAKGPGDKETNPDEVISKLEDFLGIPQSAPKI